MGCVAIPDTYLVPPEAVKSTGSSVDGAMDAQQQAKARESALATSTDEAETTGGTDAAMTSPDAPATLHASEEDRAAGRSSPLLIGDSVPGDLEYIFYREFPDGLLDCVIGRRPSVVQGVYQEYADQGSVGGVVVFASFSNTTPEPDTLDDLIGCVEAGKHVFLVGIVEPYGFQDEANANLKACADANDNVEFVDWAAVCSGHEAEYLYDDHTHLTPAGREAYLAMLASATSGDLVAG